MSSRKNELIALVIFVVASAGSPAAFAGSAETSAPNNTFWRVMFQHPKHNKPCPLTVYSEDLSATAPMSHAALPPAHVPAVEQHAGEAASEIVQNYVRGSGFVGVDDLAAYSGDPSRDEKP